MTKVFLAIPTRDRPEIETQFCLLGAMRDLEKAKIPYQFKYAIGSSLLPRTRNMFVASFMASDCTDLIMLDDDIQWEDGALMRLLSHNADVVGGAYPKREEPKQYPVRRKAGAVLDTKTGLLEVASLPTGFLRITRFALEQMIASYPDLAYRDSDVPGGIAHRLFWFECWPDDKAPHELPTFWGEDFVFCKRWTDIGGQVMLDTLLAFKHIGRKSYEGRYADDLPVASFFEAA